MASIKELKERVYEANMLLPKYELIVFTWGNVSEFDKESGLLGIKPSGVEYDDLKPEDIVILDIEGNKVEKDSLNPSSDTATHLEIYQNFPEARGVVHTHSEWATIWAQSGRDIPCYGTTQSDYFYGDIPCTRLMTPEEIASAYERNTGKVIVETFGQRGIDPAQMQAVLVHSHGPFTWGANGVDAVHNAVVLEFISKMAYASEQLGTISNKLPKIQSELLDKHFLRKHGANAYYGQKKK